MVDLVVNYPNDPKYWEEQYIESLMSPEQWFLVADDLLCSLDCLLPNVLNIFRNMYGSRDKMPSLHGVRTYMMLTSFMFENLFKGLIIFSEDFKKEDFMKSVPTALKTHDLLYLANKLTDLFKLSEEGEDLLIRLSAYGTWAGRYPAPVKDVDILPVKLKQNYSGITRTIKGRDIRNIDILVKMVYEKSDRKIPLCRVGEKLIDGFEPWELMVVSGPIKPYH